MMSRLLPGHDKEEWLKLTPCTEAMLSDPESSFSQFLSFFPVLVPIEFGRFLFTLKFTRIISVACDQKVIIDMEPQRSWETKILFLYRI